MTFKFISSPVLPSNLQILTRYHILDLKDASNSLYSNPKSWASQWTLASSHILLNSITIHSIQLQKLEQRNHPWNLPTHYQALLTLSAKYILILLISMSVDTTPGHTSFIPVLYKCNRLGPHWPPLCFFSVSCLLLQQDLGTNGSVGWECLCHH